MKTLTPKQQAVLDYINSRKFGSPSVRKVAQEFEISTATAQHYMQVLKKKGALPETKRR